MIVNPGLAAQFEASMRELYPRATNEHGVNFVAQYQEEFDAWLATRTAPTQFDPFEEHLRELSTIKATHPHLADIGDALLEAADRVARMREDVARLEWVLPMLTGEDSPLADSRTRAVGRALMRKLDGRAALDAARMEAP